MHLQTYTWMHTSLGLTCILNNTPHVERNSGKKRIVIVFDSFVIHKDRLPTLKHTYLKHNTNYSFYAIPTYMYISVTFTQNVCQRRKPSKGHETDRLESYQETLSWIYVYRDGQNSREVPFTVIFPNTVISEIYRISYLCEQLSTSSVLLIDSTGIKTQSHILDPPLLMTPPSAEKDSHSANICR